jgi:hypothetical protein
MSKFRAIAQGVTLLLISPIGLLGAYAFGLEAGGETNVPVALMLLCAAIAGLSLGAWLLYRGLRMP